MNQKKKPKEIPIRNRAKCILAVDDEPDVLQLLEYHLGNEGFRVIRAASGEEAIDVATKDIPDLILLDVMLPGISGLEVLKYLQHNQPTANIPVIFLSARSEETDIVLGLELGACDYVTKPFSIRVLISRIRTILGECKRLNSLQTIPDIIRVRDLEIFSGKRRVAIRGKDVRLTQAEFRILELLAKNRGGCFPETI